METPEVSITHENLKFGILIIYGPPNSKAANFDSLMESVAGGNRDWIDLGDFNTDILQSSALSKSYLNVISSHNFQQVIQNPTTLTKNSSSMLDHINEYPFFKNKKFKSNRVLYNRSYRCLR